MLNSKSNNSMAIGTMKASLHRCQWWGEKSKFIVFFCKYTIYRYVIFKYYLKVCLYYLLWLAFASHLILLNTVMWHVWFWKVVTFYTVHGAKIFLCVFAEENKIRYFMLNSWSDFKWNDDGSSPTRSCGVQILNM